MIIRDVTSSDNWTSILPLGFFFFLTTLITTTMRSTVMNTTIKKPNKPIVPPTVSQGKLFVDDSII